MTFLQSLYGAFLRTRRATRHFRRTALVESLGPSGAARTMPNDLARDLVRRKMKPGTRF